MRRLLMGVATGAMLTTPALARQLDPAKPEDALEITKRTQCGVRDGVAAVYGWSGNVYARVPDKPDKLLFTRQRMNVRQCATVTDPTRGRGYRQVSREVMHIANDAVNSRPSYPVGADGKPYSVTLTGTGD